MTGTYAVLFMSMLTYVRIRKQDFKAKCIRYSSKMLAEVTSKKDAKNEMTNQHMFLHKISFYMGPCNFFYSHGHKYMSFWAYSPVLALQTHLGLFLYPSLLLASIKEYNRIGKHYIAEGQAFWGKKTFFDQLSNSFR